MNEMNSNNQKLSKEAIPHIKNYCVNQMKNINPLVQYVNTDIQREKSFVYFRIVHAIGIGITYNKNQYTVLTTNKLN